MNKFRKSLMVGVLALGLGAGSLSAYAHKADGAPKGGPDGRAGFGEKHAERMKEMRQKRLAALHDKLKLSESQEAAWKAYVARTEPVGPQALQERGELAKLSVPERMEKRLGFMQEMQKRMSEHLEATKSFYATLMPEQQKIFNEEFSRGPKHGPRDHKLRHGHKHPHGHGQHGAPAQKP